jgi:hypothetical protein
LTGDVAETVGEEVRAKDTQFAMIKTTQARIGKDSLAHLVKSRLGGIGPVWVDAIRVLVQEGDAEGRNAHFEVGNKTSIKLDEPDKHCDIADQVRGRPCFDELVFGHGWVIAVDACIDANKFKMFDEDVRFLQTE